MTDEESFDNDDVLQAQLAGADPARALTPADKAGLTRLLEDTMSHDIDTAVDSHQAVATGTEGRNPRLVLVAAAAVFLVAAGGFVASALTGDDAAPPQAKSAPTVTQLSAAPATEAKCAVPTADLLSTQQLAFAGTVTSVEGDTVTLETTTAYAGDVGDVVEVTAPPADLQALLLATDFQVGQDYLVSATGGQVSVCGFSGAATPQLQQLFQDAFPG